MKILLLLSFMCFMACIQEQAKEDSDNIHKNSLPVLMQQRPTLSPPTTGFKDIFVGHGRACALKTDGTPVFWGKDFSGGRKLNGALANIKFKKVIVKDHDIIGLDLDGKIRAWGDSKSFFESINDAGPFTDFAVAYGLINFVAVKTDGSLVHKFSSHSPWDASKLPGKVKSAVAGSNEICFLNIDNVINCIRNKELSLVGHFDRLTASFYSPYICARRISDGVPECKGEFFSDYPKEVSLKIDIGVHDVAAGAADVCIIRIDNRATCFNLENNEENGRSMMTPPSTLDSVYRLSVGMHEACAIQNIGGHGTIVCWGSRNSEIVTKAPRAQ